MFYVYEWFDVDSDEIIYVGKGTGNRYKVRKHNSLFNNYIENHNCESRIIKYFDAERDAFDFEYNRIKELWDMDEAKFNLTPGGAGGMQFWWTDERRKEWSKNNSMKKADQRERMRRNNPMHNHDIAAAVGKKKRRAIIVGEITYDCAKSAAEANNVTPQTIGIWAKAGKTSDGRVCRYADGKPALQCNRTTMPRRKLSKTARPVIVDGETFESTVAAARYIGTTRNNLRIALKRDGNCKGHTCEYANQQPSQGNASDSTLEGSTTNG